MNKKNFENTNLGKLYRHVLTCKKCSQKYGHDSPDPQSTLCPFCESKSRSIKKKEEPRDRYKDERKIERMIQDYGCDAVESIILKIKNKKV